MSYLPPLRFSHPGNFSNGCSFVPVAVAQWFWLLAHDAAFAQELEAKQLARRAADLAAEASRARQQGAFGSGHMPKKITKDSRSASLPYAMHQRLLAAEDFVL